MISLMRRSIIFLHNHLANEHALQELPRVLPPFLNATYNFIHTSNEAYHKPKPDKNDLIIAETTFEHVKDRKREVYLDILRAYKKENISRRGHVEFIKLALKYMKEFGAHKDLECYKSLLDIFPKGIMIPQNKYQAMFEHYPKQQDVACRVLDQMEDFNVLPDGEMENLLLNTFGRHSTVLKKYWRIMYWMPKFKNINPWLPPKPLPTDPREIARFAIQKICFDVKTEISEFDTNTVKDAVDHTWIISGMSPLQEDLLQSHPLDVPVYVEGPTKVWVNSVIAIDYFVLRRDTIERPKLREDPDDVSDLKIRFWDKAEISLPHTIHEQEDGTYLAVCATGTSSKDSLLSWIRCLEVKNPILNKIPVLFTFISSSSQKMYIDEGFQKPLISSEVKQSQVDER